ncbi:MAG: cysteine desulfurase family protein [Myxococcota bacterium]|nr:cysteine desulfurase family protein [Myxococcota bacterium]
MSDPTKGSVYLDHNATSPPRPEVLDRALPFLTEHVGNPHATHGMARIPAAALETARGELAAWGDVHSRTVVFTSGATESNHLALRGIRCGGRPGLLYSAVEHPSLAAPAAALGGGVLPVDSDGVLDLDELRGALDDTVGLVCVMAANNETGVVQPLEEIHAICRQRGALLHVDAAQVAGRFDLGPHWDSLTLSGHKAGGLIGAGALLRRGSVDLEPQQLGGAQERGFRAGTANVAAAVGLAEALKHPWPQERLLGWRETLSAAAADAGATITGVGVKRLANTLHLTLDPVAGEVLAMALDLEGICVSTGSACASGASEPSPVLQAMGLHPRGGLRISMGWNTTPDEIEVAALALDRVVRRCKSMGEEIS